ncbi:hypothetical protein [Algoriphagus chordae]|uniref:hypothetical protein n=1 Tax=Algoriphagus chordae TaxID=237019 RepID=UPI001313FA19|nr:hypothetical protein [Algoriphagus chordae]
MNYEDAAIKSIKYLLEQSPFQTADFTDCFLTNEKFEWIGEIEMESLKQESHS